MIASMLRTVAGVATGASGSDVIRAALRIGRSAAIVIAVVAAGAAIGTGAVKAYRAAHDAGANAIRAEWLADRERWKQREAAMQGEAQRLINNAQARADSVARRHAEINDKAAARFAHDIDQIHLQARNDARRSADAGGVRITFTGALAAPGPGPDASARMPAPGASPGGAATAPPGAGWRLADATERDLRELARRADAMTAQCRALQQWAADTGRE